MNSAEDVVAVPAWTFPLRIAQIFPAIIVLGLNAFGVSYYSYNVLIFSIINTVFTFIILAYMLTASTVGSKLYNKWAFLALHIFAVIMWLCAFSLLAALASYWTDPYYYYYYYWTYKRSLEKRLVTVGAYYGALAGSAGIAAIEFVMFVIQLVVFSIHLHRQRINRAAAFAPPGYTAGSTAVAMSMGKVEHQVNTHSIADPYSANQLPVAQPMPAQPVAFPPQPTQFTQPAAGYSWQAANPVGNNLEQQPRSPQTPAPLNTQNTGASIQNASLSELGSSNIPLGAMGNAAELNSPSKATYR